MGTSQRAAGDSRPPGERLRGPTLLLVLALMVVALALVVGTVTRDGAAAIRPPADAADIWDLSTIWTDGAEIHLGAETLLTQGVQGLSMTRSYLVYTSIEGVAFRQSPGGTPQEIGDHLVEGAIGDPNGDTVAWLEDDGHGGADLVMVDVATRDQVSRVSLDIDLDEALSWRDPMLRSVDGDLVTYRIGTRSFTYRADEPEPTEITRDGEVLVDAHATQQAARTNEGDVVFYGSSAVSRVDAREWHTGQFSPDGSSFALLGYDGSVVLADPASGRLAATPIVSGGAVDLGWADEDHLMVLVDTRSDSPAVLRGDVLSCAVPSGPCRTVATDHPGFLSVPLS